MSEYERRLTVEGSGKGMDDIVLATIRSRKADTVEVGEPVLDFEGTGISGPLSTGSVKPGRLNLAALLQLTQSQIKRHREFYGFSQEELARRARTTVKYVQRLETDAHWKPSKNTLYRIAAALWLDDRQTVDMLDQYGLMMHDVVHRVIAYELDQALLLHGVPKEVKREAIKQVRAAIRMLKDAQWTEHYD